MLQFPSNALPTSLEAFLKAVHDAPGQALRFPARLEQGGSLGSDVHALQSIATWARLAEGGCPVVLPPAFASFETSRARLASTLAGMAALYFASGVRAGRSEVSRYEALEAVAPYVQAMRDGDLRSTLRGIGSALVCFAGARSEYLRLLYKQPGPGTVREQIDFRVLLPRMLSYLGSGVSARLAEGQLDLLSALVHQLFLNSEQHGAYDLDGGRFDLGMRGITVRLTSLSEVPTLVQEAGDDRPLKAYLLKQNFFAELGKDAAKRDRTTVSQVRLVEVSVFDTGPGMALRWLSEKEGLRSYQGMSAERELSAIKHCFEKHATTKASKVSGIGLSELRMYS